MTPDKQRDKFGLPTKVFFYTLDQVAGMLNMDVETLHKQTYYFQRTPGVQKSRELKAYNIAKDVMEDEAIWRIPEAELIRWLRTIGLRCYERGYPTR